jgi:hypothetical protein
MSKRRVRPQAEKGRDVSRINRVLDIRRSNAAEPIPSGARYNRAEFRKRAQRGQWED